MYQVMSVTSLFAVDAICILRTDKSGLQVVMATAMSISVQTTKNRDARIYTRIPDVAQFIVWHGMCSGYLPALTVHRRFAVLQGGC